VSVVITTVKLAVGAILGKSTYTDKVVDDLNALSAAIDTLKFAAGATTDSAAIGAETMVSSPATSFVWKSGHAYRLPITGRVSVSVANTEAIFKLRRGTTTGATLLADGGSIKVVTVGNVQHVNLAYYVKNATGADITTTVQPSLTGAGGNATWIGSGGGGLTPRGWMIEDLGPGTAAIMGALAIDI
jgi:hypothetical protein